MNSLNVPGMSCSHCTAAIEKAIKAIDPAAEVSCDLETHNVDVDSTVSESALATAIREAGYEVTLPAAI